MRYKALRVPKRVAYPGRCRMEGSSAVSSARGFIVLDLKEVPMMDSSGLGAVVTLHVSARTRGCRLEVVNASKQILELFSMTNVLSLFEATGRCGKLM